MGPNIGIWGTTEFVWSSRLWIYDQIRSGYLPAGIRDPNLRVAPTFDIGVTPISKVNVKILSQYEVMGYQSIGLNKERPNLTIFGHYLYTSVQCAISQIFQHGWIIPHFLAFLVFSLQWGHVEKWLIQFWNRLLVRTKCTMCDFPNFSTRSNNSRFSSISGVFSALGAPRKVVDTVLESSTRED